MKDYSSIASINTSLKNNREQLSQRRTPFNKDKLEGKEKYPYNKPLRFKRVSKVKLERIKRQIQQSKAEENWKIFFALAVSLIVVYAILAFVLRNIK